MAEPLQPSLHGALSDLTRWLDAERIPSTIIGGVAASALGRPRLTKDIDALAIVPEEGWAKAIQSASRHGIVPRIEGALEFALRSRVLLLTHTASGIDLDVTLGGLPFEEAAVAKSQEHNIGGLRVRFPRVEDLLVMKAIARRPKDIEDIRGLLAANPHADIKEARRWVREFAAAMSMSDMLEEFDRLVAWPLAGPQSAEREEISEDHSRAKQGSSTPSSGAGDELEEARRRGRENWLQTRRQQLESGTPTIEETQAKAREDWLELRHQQKSRESKDVADNVRSRDLEQDKPAADSGKGINDDDLGR